MTKTKLTGRKIHIKAICPYFEIHEIIDEEKSVKRLEDILKSFKWYNREVHKIEYLYQYRPKTILNPMRVEGAKLKVTTGVHNPTLFPV